MLPTTMKRQGCIFLCGGSDAGMHFDVTHADRNALSEFIKVNFLLGSPIIRVICCSQVPFYIPQVNNDLWHKLINNV